MRRITRYLLWELCLVFGLTLVGMTIVLILGIIAKEGVRQGLGAQEILRLTPYALPGALRFSIPAALLLATCSTFGRLSADNELVALKSLGIAPNVVLWPAFGVAICVSLAAMWLNDVAITWGTQGIYHVIAESVESVVYRTLATQGSYSADGISINVKSVDGDRLVQPTIVLRTRNGVATIVAREASLKANLPEHRLMLQLYDGMIEKDDQATYAFPDVYQHEIPLSALARRNQRDVSPSEIALRDLTQATDAQQERIAALEQQIAARATVQIALGEFSEMHDPAWRALESEQHSVTDRMRRLQLEPWRRIANGFSCLFFVLVGAPLAIQQRTSNLFTTFGMCFLPILFVYYPLLMLSVDRAKDGAWPAYSVWLANGVLLIVATVLIRKVQRH